MIVVDTSGSMGESGMATVRSATTDFLRRVPRDVLVGVASFSDKAVVNVSPTTDRSTVQRAVDGLISRGETALYDGITAAVAAMGATGDRSLILLSDGGDTASGTSTSASVVKQLRDAKVRAEIVAFKNKESDSSVLARFATAGGGKVAAAGDSGAVKAAFTAAAEALNAQTTFSAQMPPGVKDLQSVVLVGKAAGAEFHAEAKVDFGAGVAVEETKTADVEVVEPTPAAIDRLTATAAQPWVLLGGAGLIGSALLAGMLLMVLPRLKSDGPRGAHTVEQYLAARTQTTSHASTSPSAISESIVGFGDRVMRSRESTPKTMALIERADLPLRPGEWWVLRLVGSAVGAAGFVVLFRGSLVVTLASALLGGAVGYLVPSLILRFLAKRRSRQFEAQLPDVLMLVASSLSTGFSLPQALDAVAKDAAQPAAKEFSRALAETRVGTDISDALERMGERMQSVNMKWTTMTIRIQREVGGNLAETLRNTAKTLREREALGRHVKALSAEGKLSAYILIALPIGIFLFTMKTNREYIELLWTRGLGLAMLGAGVVSMAIGIFWMRKVVDVKV
jgi:tight adherence protein B